MVRIPPPRKTPGRSAAPPRRRPSLPGWVPLALSAIGVAFTLAPDDVASWPMRVLGVAMLGAGSFWLGQQREHDPTDLSRIRQLEATILRFGVLDRELGVRRDLAATLGTERTRAPTAGAEPGSHADDGASGSGGGQLRAVPEPAEPDLDAPLPGER